MSFLQKALGKMRLSKRSEPNPPRRDAETFDKNNTTPNDSTKFEYRPLQKNETEVRLLKIERREKGPLVECTLRHVSLTSDLNFRPKYTALSYCWGDPDDTCEIMVNGCIVVVTRNLRKALGQMRHRNLGYIWIDALCINQDDRDERSHQVLRMQEIYSKAYRTVVWLGSDGGGYAETAFECMGILATEKPSTEYHEIINSVQEDRPEPDDSRIIAVRKMIGLPYWKRTWVIQELVLSRNLLLLWDQSSIKGWIFKDGLGELMRFTPKICFFNGWNEIRGIFRVMDSFESTDENSNGISLQFALSHTALSQANDPRDKIFGVLGLCSDAATLIPSPNYYHSLDTISRELRIAQIRQSVPDDQDATHPIDLICLDNPKVPKRSTLPSWVTDWPAIWKSRSARPYSRTTDRGLNSGYLACGRSRSSVEFSDGGLVLRARGYVFDSITDLSFCTSSQGPSDSTSFSGVSVYRNPYKTTAGIYDTIWRVLVMDRRAQGSISRATTDFGCHFPSLYLQSTKALLARRPGSVRSSVDHVRNFQIHGRTLEQWAELGSTLLADTSAVDNVGIAEEKSEHGSEELDVTLVNFIRNIRLGMILQRLMITQKGYIGMVHQQSRVGDSICLLGGGTLPMILRPCEGGYTVVGECYVHGNMDGEFWNAQDGSTMREFYLY